MANNRSIQKLGSQRAGAIMTPQGPAVIQVIDMPQGGGGGGMNYAGSGMPARKVGGINIIGAILKRWWLVLLVTGLIGFAGIYTANNFIKPSYSTIAKVSWTDKTADGQGMARLTAQAVDVITSQRIPLIAAMEPEMQHAMPGLVRGRDMNDPSVQVDVIKQLQDIVTADADKRTQVVTISCIRPDPVEAAEICNAFAKAFVKYCQDEVKGDVTFQIQQAEQVVQEKLTTKGALIAERTRIAIENNIDRDSAGASDTFGKVSKMIDDQLSAKLQFAAADAKLQQMKNSGVRRPDQELQAIKMKEDERQKDNILQTYNQQLVNALANLESEKAIKKDEHPDVRRAFDQVNRLKQMVMARQTEIDAIITERIDKQFVLIDAKSVAEAMEKVDAAQKMLKFYTDELAKMDEKAKRLVWVKSQLSALDDQIGLVGRDYDVNYSSLQELKAMDRQFSLNSGIRIAELAKILDKPDQDKRSKVQAAGVVGGLFLGMLLALLVDRFDKRLRDPRDVEPLLGAPLLGTIPKINELKRMKGEHARNLIAEEFRVIRTQLLFGNPELHYKTIAITSPQPGDGKTSLAVNLAISIAKSGRRVLLIDADLRKPDIHRIFNVSDSPGFAEVIAGSHEPGSAIKKSDIDGLDILPAGTPIIRPSELLSRPEVARVLAALGEIYDHIILDTAPLLPVSDTHVLVGLVDGVMCSFNAEVERGTVTHIQEILRRSNANVIGTVLNRVKYKQSGSYHRGKSAYSSYYASTRVPSAPAPGDPGIATLTKH